MCVCRIYMEMKGVCGDGKLRKYGCKDMDLGDAVTWWRCGVL